MRRKKSGLSLPRKRVLAKQRRIMNKPRDSALAALHIRREGIYLSGHIQQKLAYLKQGGIKCHELLKRSFSFSGWIEVCARGVSVKNRRCVFFDPTCKYSGTGFARGILIFQSPFNLTRARETGEGKGTL